MKEISYRLRKALIDALEPFVFEGVEIPIFDQKVNPSRSIPICRGAFVYVVINSQTASETTNDKCKIRLDANISFDIVTKYPSGSGGSILSELIGEIILGTVNRDLVIPDFQLMTVTKNFNDNRFEKSNSQDAHTKLLSYRFDVFEN